MTGEQLGQTRVRADIARGTTQRSHPSMDEITGAYAPQIAALDRPRRPTSSPD